MQGSFCRFIVWLQCWLYRIKTCFPQLSKCFHIFWSSDSKINLIFFTSKKEKKSVTKTGNAFLVPSVLCQREASETWEKKIAIMWLKTLNSLELPQLTALKILFYYCLESSCFLNKEIKCLLMEFISSSKNFLRSFSPVTLCSI